MRSSLRVMRGIQRRSRRLGLRVAIGVALLLGLAAPSWAHPVGAGHRGGRVMRPENTLPTYDYSLSNGVDWVEFDL